MTIVTVSTLGDRELEAELARLVRGEREAMVALLVHLGEFDARRLHEPAGFSSLFRYCVEVLSLSEDATYNRIEAARATRRFPEILDLLASGALSLTTARLLARKLTDANHSESLEAASGKTKEEVEALLAGWFPRPDVADSVRKCPGTTSAALAPQPTAQSPAPAVSVTATPPTPRPTVRALASERYEIRFTARVETRKLLRTAQDLIADSVADADLDGVFHRALELLVADLERRKCAATVRPRPSRGQADDSRHIPADVKRIVWSRDGGRCAFVSRSGRRCEARRHLHFHHVVPYAAGGEPTADNIQMRCRAHNNYEARVFYGPMREYGDPAPPATRSGTSSPP
jgi:hypothetical protein